MVRTVESCDAQIQEYARIIFVDDVLNHPRKIEDHAPLEGRASFDSLFDGAKSKVVRFLICSCSLKLLTAKLIKIHRFLFVDFELSHDGLQISRHLLHCSCTAKSPIKFNWCQFEKCRTVCSDSTAL